MISSKPRIRFKKIKSYIGPRPCLIRAYIA